MEHRYKRLLAILYFGIVIQLLPLQIIVLIFQPQNWQFLVLLLSVGILAINAVVIISRINLIEVPVNYSKRFPLRRSIIAILNGCEIFFIGYTLVSYIK
jgi:uncharacterized membrane protein YbhN (UPF0104 family)